MIHEDLTANYGKAAAGLEDFIVALRPYDTYWLTTHCTTGDPVNAVRIMKAVLPQSLHADIERIRPTTWDTFKTEGIDWSQDFIWFDNDIFPAEWERMRQGRDGQLVIEVNLKQNPEQLIEITNSVL